MTYTLTDNSQMLAPEDWPTEDRAHRRAIGHPLWRATDWTIYDDRGRPVRTRFTTDDDRDAAVERAEKAETEVRDAPPRPLDPTNPDDLRAVGHMETTIQPRLLAVNDAATYLGVSRSSLLRALDNGDIPRVRIAGRVLVDRHDLDTLIDTAKATA